MWDSNLMLNDRFYFVADSAIHLTTEANCLGYINRRSWCKMYFVVIFGLMKWNIFSFCLHFCLCIIDIELLIKKKKLHWIWTRHLSHFTQTHYHWAKPVICKANSYTILVLQDMSEFVRQKKLDMMKLLTMNSTLIVVIITIRMYSFCIQHNRIVTL